MSTLPVPPHIEEIAAPMMLGALWNWTLYGVLVVQLYIYNYNFPEDRTLLKLLVYSVFLVETLQTALTGADLYYWFVSGFGNLDHLTSPNLSEFDVPIISSVISLAVQLFFVYRIWVFSGRSSRIMCLIICFCATIVGVASFSTGVYGRVHNKFASNQTLKILTLIWLGVNTLSDILIAGSMVFYLRRQREEVNDYFSNHALSRVVRLTVETNVLTTTVGIVSLVTVAAFPDKPWFTCPIAILGKLYSNTLLVSLNNRVSIRDGPISVGSSPETTFAFTTISGPAMEIVHVDLKALEVSSRAGFPEDSARQDTSRVFGIA